jgi:predicted DNA-binding transcriptional regulator AlpA
MKSPRASIALLPRLVRFRDAPAYLGMDRNRFNHEVRPFLTKIPIGQQGIAFDRLELDAWVEDYISRNGRRPKAPKLEDDTCQNVTECRGSAKKAGSGTLKSAAAMHKEDGSEKARAYLRALRQSNT